MIENLKTFKFNYINHDIELIIQEELQNYLTLVKKKYVINELDYILKELVGNANKANMKRVHFNIKELDINNQSDYEKGIQTFRDELSNNYDLYTSSAKNYGFFIRLDFYISKGNLIISAINNCSMLSIEKERLLQKIKNASRFKTFEDALLNGFDSNEGGGFGIILSMMMLRKLGLDERYFKLINNEEYTQTEIIIPLSLLSHEEGERIANVIIKEIDEIPQFPKHISDLEKMLIDPNANFTKINDIIKKDPSLIADLLKIANSALYMLPHKVNSIEEAVRLIGFKGIRNLVVTYTTRNILMSKYSQNSIKPIMEHSYEVAYYAYELAKNLKLKSIIDDVYLAGILHDFGKIIVSSIKPDLLDKIKKLSNVKGINRNIIENLTKGYNHSLIGAKLANKWNFAESLNEAIMYHHNALESSDENHNLVNIIYLADILYYYKRQEFDFIYINNQILKQYNFNEQKDFEDFITPIINDFDRLSKTKKNI